MPFLCTVKKLCNTGSIAKEQIGLQDDFRQKVDEGEEGNRIVYRREKVRVSFANT